MVLPLRIAWIVCLALVGCSTTSGTARLDVHAPGVNHPRGRLELRGATGSMRVRVANAPPRAPDVLGEVHVEGGCLVFTPRFPFQRGLTYSVSTDVDAAAPFEFTLHAPPLEARVALLGVYPDAKELPANLLKFYVHFSGPMRRGEAYRRARLLDESGAEVLGAFLPVEPELWNPERTRLTLLIDPGRIKRGLVPHEELGPVLYPQRAYALELDAAWRDERGAPLQAGLRHAFRTTASDVQCPDPWQWNLALPRAATRDALAVRFDEVLDRALAGRVLTIEDPDGLRVVGHAAVDDDQGGWRFYPTDPWRAGLHALRVPALLEDLAGNSVGRPFEVNAPNGHDPTEDLTVRLAFVPR